MQQSGLVKVNEYQKNTWNLKSEINKNNSV